MDLDKAIRELYEEKKLLDQVIASLELLLETEQDRPPAAEPKRRGRKTMSPEERLEVSQRMKDYWAQRRRAARRSESSKSTVKAKDSPEAVADSFG